MAALYMSVNPYAGLASENGAGGRTPLIPTNPPSKRVGSVGPVSAGSFTSGVPPPSGIPAPVPAPTAPNVVGAQAVRATGDRKGYDPSYLQNLATAIGGLFSRPQGNLNFNPLGDLSGISPSSGMGGNAPLPGLPSTWLQDALNGLGFRFSPAAPAPVGPGGRDGGGFGGGDSDGKRRGGRLFNLQ